MQVANNAESLRLIRQTENLKMQQYRDQRNKEHALEQSRVLRDPPVHKDDKEINYGHLDASQLGPGGVPKGSKTSTFYTTDNIPKRFENPEWFKGYEQKSEHPMFRTSNSAYGNRAPCVHTMPQKYKSRSQKFTNHLGPCGMFRNHSLNTSIEQKVTPDHVTGHVYY